MQPNRPTMTLPLAFAAVRAGFPSPAEDYLEAGIDLNAYLVDDPPASFLVRVRGDSMLGAGIADGDVLVVDKGLSAQHGDIVVAVVDGECTVKRLSLQRGRCQLLAENPAYPAIELADGQELQVWGVVVSCAKRLRRR